MPLIGPEITLICDQCGKQSTIGYPFPDDKLEKFGELPLVAEVRGWCGGGAGGMPIFCSAPCFDAGWNEHAEKA